MPGILANDSDDLLTPILVTTTAHGTVVLQPAGAFLYTPHPNFFGNDSFTYRASDGSASTNIAMVTLNIASVNDPPVAIQDSYVTLMEAPRVVGAPGVLANDLDADLDTLIAILATGPVEGTLALNPDGSFVYSPDTCFVGNVSFTYRVSDGTATSASAATVTIAVYGLGAPPSGAMPDSFTVNEDAPLTIAAPGILTNDGDRCSPPLTAELVSAPLRGTLMLNPNGGFDYTPNADFNGIDSFTYRARDGFLFSNTAQVAIHVQPVNDPPVFTINPGQDFVFDDDVGPQRVEHFLTNRSAGPSEQSQRLSLSVTNDRQDLFAQQPAIDGTGALTFTPCA